MAYSFTIEYSHGNFAHRVYVKASPNCDRSYRSPGKRRHKKEAMVERSAECPEFVSACPNRETLVEVQSSELTNGIAGGWVCVTYQA